jgi:biotin operon repressor
MSFQAMTWAVEQELPALQKLVLLMLANCCNHHTKQCNPSHETLARECGMSRESVKRSISELAEKGILTIRRRSQEGISLPNQYDLNLRGGGVSQNQGWGLTEQGVGSHRPTNQEVEPGIEPIHTPRASASISLILRKYSINSNPSHPVVLAMAEQGVDLETLEACCKETREAKPNETVSVSYIAKKLEGWKAQADIVNVSGAVKKKAPDTWFLSPSAMSAKARELGIPDARMGETEAAFKSRIQQAINGRAA